MLSWLASGGPPYVPAGTPAPTPSPGFYITAPGINIGQLLGILLPLVVCAIAVLTYRDVRLHRRQREASQDIQKAVENLASILSERMETKENVAVIRERIASLRTEVATLREVIRELNRTVEQIQARRRGGGP